VYILDSGNVGANSRVRARLASSNGLLQQATITLSVVYYRVLI